MKTILKYIFLFAVTATLLIGSFLLSVTLIPSSSIRQNLQRSAGELTEMDSPFYYVLKDVECSRIDQYADSILLCIAWYMDSKHPVDSVVWAKYYRGNKGPAATVNASFHKAVSTAPPPPADEQYLRYWHGSLLLIRPLLLLFDLREIYILHGILLAGLLLWLSRILLKKNCLEEVIALWIALAAVNIWFVPRCLEFTWVFLLALVISIISVKMAWKGQYTHFGALFLITGIVAAFLDFFTTELLTLLIPLLLILRIRERKELLQENWKLIISCGLLWGIGYAGMWSLKWGLSALITGEDVTKYLKTNFQVHLGTMGNMSLLQLKVEALTRNISALFPM